MGAHLGARIKIGQPGDAEADFWVESHARDEKKALEPKAVTETHVDLADLIEFGFNVVRKKLLGACVKLKQFFGIVSPTGKCEVMEEPCGDRHQRIDKIMTTPERMLENGAVAWVSAKQASPLPSGGPDAQDQVSILASDGSYFHTGVWNIGRDREGTVVALDLFFRDPEPLSKGQRRPDASPDDVGDDSAK